MKLKCNDLSKAQSALFLSLPDFGTKHVVTYYKPASKLVEVGLAYWFKENKLALTALGFAERHELKSLSFDKECVEKQA